LGVREPQNMLSRAGTSVHGVQGLARTLEGEVVSERWIRGAASCALYTQKPTNMSYSRCEHKNFVYSTDATNVGIVTWWTVVPTKAAAVAETSTTAMYIKVVI